MEKIFQYFFILFFIIFLNGCAPIQETAKVIWGSSTNALEKARPQAISKTFHCNFDECFDAVVSLEHTSKSKEFIPEGVFDIFIKDRKKAHLVVMGVTGSEQATEVGIFFVRMSPEIVKIEISSLSHTAKEKAAEAIFATLTSKFKESQ